MYSNYDSDVFTPLLSAVAIRAGVRYGEQDTTDRSMRVVAVEPSTVLVPNLRW